MKTFENPNIEVVVLIEENIMDDIISGEQGTGSAVTPDA
jgi:hypothetical protein